MSIDLDVQMIVPQQSESKLPFFKDVSVIINHFVKNGVLIKRVEAFKREAAVFNGTGNQIITRYKTEFDILNAFFVTFTPKTPEDYLCLIGNDQIDFYSQDANFGMCCPIALPFKICRAHPCNFGVVLERSSFPGECGNPPGAAQLFSLTHPYNEIMPILCKFKGDSDCHYAFRSKRIAVVSKDIAANWTASFSGPIDFLMCYDFDERRNHLFLIRKCTKEERIAAKNDLGVLNSSALMHTPSTVRSFYSPNFFNRRFAENRLAAIGLRNSQMVTDTNLHQSPAGCFNNLLFANSNGSSQLNPLSQTTSASISNTAPSKTPITRRITRSMAAAVATGDFSNPSFGMGALSSADKSGSFHRSLEHNAALNRMRLKQKRAIAAGNNVTGNAYVNSTPRLAHSFAAVDMDDLLSFGGRETDEEPPSPLNMAVEFCLDWLWSEPLPLPIEDPIVTRSGSISSVGTEKVAQKLQTLQVSSSASSHSDEATHKINNADRMASTSFISRQALTRSERCIVFHIPSDRRVIVLNIHFPKALEDSSRSIPEPVITENGGPSCFIRGDSAVPFLHAPFFMVLLNFSFTDSPTAFTIALYTGCTKIANIALNIGIPNTICNTLLRLLPGGLCATGYNQYEIGIFVGTEYDSRAHHINEDDAFISSTFRHFSYKIQLGFNSRLANRCLMEICEWIGTARQIQFLSRLFCSNPWKIIKEAQKIPFVDEVPTECIELALLFEHVFEDFCYDTKEMPFHNLLLRIRSNEEDGEEREAKRIRQNTQNIEDLLNNDHYWLLLRTDRQIALDAMSLMDNLRGIKFMNERILERIRKIIFHSSRPRLANFSFNNKKRNTDKVIDDAYKWISSPIWTNDLRVHNVQQMLDSSQPILIPSKDLGHTLNEVHQREQHEQFLLSVAIRTVTRPFGKAAVNFRIRHAFKESGTAPETKLIKDEGIINNKNFVSIKHSQMGLRPICLNGRVHPGWHQVDFPLNDTNPSHKLAMDWANFYNGLAHGFSYCGGFSAHIFSSINKEDGCNDNQLSTTERAGLFLAAGLTGCVRNTMNLYDIHALLTQNDKHLIIALLIGCAAAYRGTSEVHIYKMIAAHLPFLLQPTLVEFKIELSIQTSAIFSLGLLFAETANHNVSSKLLNQISLEVPCESDQAFERYSFVLTAGMAIGLINLGKGKEITDTEIPISSTPSLKERLIKLLNGGERRLAYLSYDRVECSGMCIGNCANNNGGGSNLLYSLRRYTPGGSSMDVVGSVNGAGTSVGVSSTTTSVNQQQNQNINSNSSRDYSGIGQPMSNHVRELPTLNTHLTAPAAVVALGLMYLRTRDEWIYEALSVKDSFYEIDKIRPDMLMIRTFCRCLVKFDDIQPTKQWIDNQIPELVRRYSQNFVEAQLPEDIWWEEHIDVETISKVHLYCSAGALLALSLRFASSCQNDAFSLILKFYERITSIDINQRKSEEQFSWSGFALRAGRNCLQACTNVCALSMGLLMAGSGDLQTTRILRKIRNILPSFDESENKNKSTNCILPKDSSVHSLHVCTNMALGFLYFGYGRYRLSDSNLSIAALVISIFPIFPHSITDNRFYFQPLRFLWTLAAEKNSNPKCLRKLSRGRKIKGIIKYGEKDFERDEEEDQEIVDCPRCGRIEITKNEMFSSF